MSNAPSTPAPLAVRPKEAARLLNISERTLFTLTKRGEIPAKKAGTGKKAAVLYRMIDLEAWLANQPTNS